MRTPPVTTLAAIQRKRSRRILAVAALSVPTVLVAIDISVVAVALPSIARDLQATASELLWIVDIYNYLVAATMLTMGGLADRLGRRRTILGCAAVFALASAVGAFAPSAAVLIGARAVMGIAGAAILPTAMSLLGVVFTDPKARLQAMGALMTVFLLGMTAAPFVGGLLLANFWWGSVFLVGVPVMVVTLIAVPLLVPDVRVPNAPRVDIANTALSVVGILALVYGLKVAVNEGVTPLALAAIVAGALAAVVFVRQQRRRAHPMIDLRVFADGRTGRALTAMFLTSVLMGGSALFFNLYLQEVQELTPLEAAGWMVPQLAAMIVASNLGPLLTRRFPAARVIVAMVSVMTAGFAIYAVLPETVAGRPLVALGSALAAFGVGAAYPLLMDSVMGSAEPERAASTAALAQLSNELGIAVGLTILGTVGTLVYRMHLDLPGSAQSVSVVAGVDHANGPEQLFAVRDAFTGAFNIVGVIGVLVLILVLRLMVRRAPLGVSDVVAAESRQA
jgi:DHA2 family multidrug resistance protein-like MFS transporter